ncbi:hypothetical protein HY30_12025 [Hyphomonas chukchiensis]|uniref:Uncharacterized protein n=2 Tax=Hyphomonas chukchiensis TaxID=1280947 RepID=A0A062URW0_9PROT|nr:hypothetical protein HY30_12025 [Hyphomonas chukchiensis]
MKHAQRLAKAMAGSRWARALLSVGLHALVLGAVLLVNPWRPRPPVATAPLIVDLIVEPPPETPPPPAPAPPAPVETVPARRALPKLETQATRAPPAAAPDDAPGETLILPEESAPGTQETGNVPEGPGVDPAVQTALAMMFCGRMSPEEREAADCPPEPKPDPFDREPWFRLATPEEKRLQALYSEKLARTGGYDNLLEWYVEHDKPIPKVLPGGIDNSIFVDRKSEADIQHDRLMRGGTMEWEDDIRRAHGQ